MRSQPRRIRAIDGAHVARRATPSAWSRRERAFWITDILSDDDARAYMFGRGGSLEFPFTVAAKTGTSQAYHDNWAVGYTRDVTVGVWVGNFDRTPLRDSSGVTGAGPIFHEVMMAAVETVARRDHAAHVTGAASVAPIDASERIVPPTSNVHRVRVCAVSGLAAGAACPVRATEWMPTDAPLEECTWHHSSDEGLVTVWPEVYRDWARSAGLLPSPTSPPSLLTRPSAVATRLVSTSSSSGGPLAIVTPLAGAVYLLDPTLRREFQALPLRATGGAPGARQWFVDGTPLGSEHDDAPLQWPLTNGAHAFTVRDTVGKTVSTTVIVR